MGNFDYNDPDLDDYARAAFDVKVNAAMRHREYRKEIEATYHNGESRRNGGYSSSSTARDRRLSHSTAWLNPAETRRVRTELQQKDTLRAKNNNSTTSQNNNNFQLPTFAPILSPSATKPANNNNSNTARGGVDSLAKSPYAHALVKDDHHRI